MTWPRSHSKAVAEPEPVPASLLSCTLLQLGRNRHGWSSGGHRIRHDLSVHLVWKWLHPPITTCTDSKSKKNKRVMISVLMETLTGEGHLIHPMMGRVGVMVRRYS